MNTIAKPSQAEAKETRLVQALGGRHGSLDGKASNVLPALLEKRDEVVDGQHNVGDELLLGHLDVADGDTHAENLLELELDGGLDLVDAASQVVGVRDGSGELAGLGQTRTQETGDLLDEGLGGNEGVVLAGKLLDELLVLVELLQVISGHGVNTTVLGTIDIVLVTENAVNLLASNSLGSVDSSAVPDGHVGSGDGGQADGARETLVTLRVIVLQADLKLNSLKEVTLLGLVGVLQELSDLRPDISCIAVSILAVSYYCTVTPRVSSVSSGIYRTDCDLRHLDSLPIDSCII